MPLIIICENHLTQDVAGFCLFENQLKADIGVKFFFNQLTPDLVKRIQVCIKHV